MWPVFKIDIENMLPYRWSEFYFKNIKPVFFPNNRIILDTIPKQPANISDLIVDVNFAMIKQFYEKDYLLGLVYWEATKDLEQFEQWLKEAYVYICYKRPSLKAELKYGVSLQEALDNSCCTTEEEITKNDTKILVQMMKYKNYFWI